MSFERLASWGLAAAFVTVVGLAAADAVRTRGDEPPPATTAELPERERLVERLRTAGVRGELLVTAPGGCDRHAWTLPRLERVFRDRGGCAPAVAVAAVRPDGALTRVTEHGVVLAARGRGCGGSLACDRLLLPRAALERAALRHPNAPLLSPRLRVLVDGLAWLTDRDVAVLLSIRRTGRPDLRGNQVLAFFERGRLQAVRSYFRGDLTQLRASPDGAYVAFLPRYVVRADGSALDSPILRWAQALAWSPDGRWLALAQRGNVALVSVPSLERHQATGASVRTIDLPLEAAHLEWR